MDIIDALMLAKEQGKSVSLVKNLSPDWHIVYENGQFYKINNDKTSSYAVTIPAEWIFEDWELVEDEDEKETQIKIDSMKFRIIRNCYKFGNSCQGCKLHEFCLKSGKEPPIDTVLEDWGMKEILKAYNLLKRKCGEINE